MLTSPDLVLRSLSRELSAFFDQEMAEASTGQSLTAAIRLLQVREGGGVVLMRKRFEALDRLLLGLVKVMDSAGSQAELSGLHETALRARKLGSLEELESAWSALLYAMEAFAAKLAATPAVSAAKRADLAVEIGAWEIADRKSMTLAVDSDASADTGITRERLEAYLRDRFGEPGLVVPQFRPLPGGFGKQTILFNVDGRALTGALVMRRDLGEPTVDNDCHRIRNEYPVLRAAHERGFPAPEALWLDTEHPLLPGGDFLVMRCAPGQTGGNVFRATTSLTHQLAEVLAKGVAGLHTLPPCTELGDLTDSIRAEWWNLPARECVRRYIAGWYELYMRDAHNPSPTLVSLYGWLLENVPQNDGRPVLLHGDIGFHNMLVDEGRLSVLLDWEFAHIGDPAEDLGYAKNTSGGMDWDRFMAHYRAAGGPEIDPVRLHFFQVWGQVRNASASNLTTGKFATGRISDLKLVYTGHYHYPHFIQAACDLVKAGPGGRTDAVGY